jgi:hypothetical protein
MVAVQKYSIVTRRHKLLADETTRHITLSTPQRSHSHITSEPIVQLENGHPTALGDLDYPGQFNIMRGDPIVPDKPVWLVVTVRTTFSCLEMCPLITENLWKARSRLTSMNFITFPATYFASVEREMVS